MIGHTVGSGAFLKLYGRPLRSAGVALHVHLGVHFANPMVRAKTVKDVPADVFVQALAAHFKKTDKLKVPAWVDLVKTGSHKELAPLSPDWYYVRAAAIARRVYVRGGSVGGLAKAFGGANRKGSRPNRYSTASTGIIRNALQQLEAAGLVAKSENGGRRVTAAGQKEMDTVAGKIEIRSALSSQ